MGLYGLPEGAFESMWNNKEPAGIVVVWETSSCLAGGSGSVLALVHLPCYAWANNSVILPPIGFCSFETLFSTHLIIMQHVLPVLFDTGVQCHPHSYQHWETTFRVLRQKHNVRKQTLNVKVIHVSCIWNSHSVLEQSKFFFVGAVTHLSELLMDWLILGLLLPFQHRENTTTLQYFWSICCHTCFTLQNHVYSFVHNGKFVDNVLYNYIVSFKWNK